MSLLAGTPRAGGGDSHCGGGLSTFCVGVALCADGFAEATLGAAGVGASIDPRAAWIKGAAVDLDAGFSELVC